MLREVCINDPISVRNLLLLVPKDFTMKYVLYLTWFCFPPTASLPYWTRIGIPYLTYKTLRQRTLETKQKSSSDGHQHGLPCHSTHPNQAHRDWWWPSNDDARPWILLDYGTEVNFCRNALMPLLWKGSAPKRVATIVSLWGDCWMDGRDGWPNDGIMLLLRIFSSYGCCCHCRCRRRAVWVSFSHQIVEKHAAEQHVDKRNILLSWRVLYFGAIWESVRAFSSALMRVIY